MLVKRIGDAWPIVLTLMAVCLSRSTVSRSLKVSTCTSTDVRRFVTRTEVKHPSFAFCTNGSNRSWLATLECFGVVTSVLDTTSPASLPRQEVGNSYLLYT